MKENKEKLNLKEALKNLKRTIKYLKPYKKQVFLNVLLTLIITVLSVLGPLLSAKLMIYLTNGNLNKILIIALIILIFEVCECIFHNLDHLLFSKMNEKVVLSIQMELLKEIFNLETKEFDKTNSGIFIERLRRDTRDISRIFSSLNTSIFSALSSLGVLITIFALNKIMFCFMIFSMICKYIIQERRTVKVKHLRDKYHELEEKNKYILATKELLEKAYEKMKNNVTPKFTQNLSNIASNISNGKYKKVIFDEEKGLVVELETGEYISANRLSIGTIDELYLSLRLSMLDEISSEKMPIILDEAFAYFDDERLKNCLIFLAEQSEKHQIIILTCSNRERQILDSVNIKYNLVEL